MKRLLMIWFVLLLLTGCSSQEAPTTAPSTTVPVETEPPGLYDPDSTAEQETGGSVRAYRLEGDNYTWIKTVDRGLLLASDATELTLLTGERCVPEVTAVAGTTLAYNAADLCVTGGRIFYYNPGSNEVVFLNGDLQEVSRTQMPADFQGSPVVRAATEEIFYCAGQEVRALNPQTGISRLVKQQNCQSQELIGSVFDGEILACETVDTLGQRYVLYVSAETGETLYSDNNVFYLRSWQDSYFAIRMDGITQQQIFGTLEGQTRQLNLQQQSGIEAVLQLGGAITYTAAETGLAVSFYDLSTGLRSAEVMIPGAEAPVCITADARYVWILTSQSGGQVLYRWDISASAIADEAVYLSPLYTAAAPDETGLALCEERIDELDDRFDIRIHIWQEAVEDPGEYILTPEYQVSAIDRWLDALTGVLERFPEDFFEESVEGSDSGKLHICLVRSIATGEAGVQYWYDGDAYVVMTADAAADTELIKAMGYVVDSHVIGNSLALDTWEELNPAGFVYGEVLSDSRYLEGDQRAFADAESMRSARADRSSLFAAAMAPDHQEVFTSEAMQAKLMRLCQGIREAFDLEKDPNVLPWEQHLNISLAYIEEQ